MADDFTITDKPGASRYELAIEGRLCVADYDLSGSVLTITHVGVPKELEGRGIASRLMKFVADDARARGLKIVPVCSFADAFLRRHTEYADLR